MRLVKALWKNARKDLERDGIIELVSVTLTAVPDPKKSRDRIVLKVRADVADNFRHGIPAVDRALDKVDTIATAGEEDISPQLRDALCTRLGMGNAGPVIKIVVGSF
jgi:hypothetical protein